MKIQKLSHLMNRYLPSLGLALLIAIPIYTPAHASTRTTAGVGVQGRGNNDPVTPAPAAKPSSKVEGNTAGQRRLQKGAAAPAGPRWCGVFQGS